jgi:AbrB family looped-hinge helix DNA binding protein
MKNKKDCCASKCKDVSCKVESLISVDERGQMILPKGLRNKADIKTGDKLVLVSFEREGKVCCISLIKADVFSDMVKGMLGPLMEGMINNSSKTK